MLALPISKRTGGTPSPDNGGYEQRLPVNWDAICKQGITATNYQIFPGDRIYIRASELNRLDAMVARATAPVERIAGTMFLTTATVRNLGGSFRDSNNGNLGNFFSDRRLKTDIRQVGTSRSDIAIYHFRYRGELQWYQGVIAQDLLATHPEAIVRAANGYLMVNYRLLDVEFRPLTAAEVAKENRRKRRTKAGISPEK